jgi:hypothetical protein
MHRIALSFLLAALAIPAAAQAPRSCGNPADLAERLAAEYRETPTARGIDAGGNLITVYSNAETGTWTLVVFSPAVACGLIAASGEGWEQMEYAPPPAPDKPS